MEQQALERLSELYQQGWGLKKLSRELDIPVSTIRRHLLRAGCYQGAARASGERETSEQSIYFSITTSKEEVTRSAEIPPLGEWTCRGDVAVRKDDAGWIVSLGAGFDASLVSPPLEGEWTGKGIEVCADMRLISPPFGSLCLGVRDENMLQGDEGSCLLQAGFVPSRYFIKHVCGASPVLYLKGNSYSATTAHISNVLVREISTMGLKPIPLPVEEKKKLEIGERIDLAHSWQSDGADISLCSWSAGAVEIIFRALTSTVYAQLPPETLNREIKLVLTMRSLSGSFSLEAVLGDDAGKTAQDGFINRKPCTWELERNMEENGHVRILGKTYGRERIILEESFVKLVA